MWPAARVCEDGVEGDEMWVKIVAKLELPNPNKLGDYIGEGSARLEGNRDIKSLHSLQIFPKRDHTGRMLFVVVANDFCWSRGTSIAQLFGLISLKCVIGQSMIKSKNKYTYAMK
jgi:hypothetical protein